MPPKLDSSYSDHVEAQKAVQRRERRRRPWLDAARIPFRDDAPMVGPPKTTAADFEMPRLRRCPFDQDSMVFEARLGGGLDGYVWKVRFGAQEPHQGPFALKVFWDAEPVDFPTYYAPQRECQNAALLQMMQTAVEQANAAGRPILVNAKPTTRDDAVANLAAFSDEARLKQQPSPADGSSVTPPGLCQISTMPRMKKCYGWLTIHGSAFRELHRSVRPPLVHVDRKIKRHLAPDQEYIAILYEYVEEGENDPDTMQKAMDFFWLAGFSRTSSPL
ncbi:bce21ee6-5e8b-4ec3-aefc-9edd551823b1 [Thermothielavioides terrestris]|uniref:Bce21ee6-5e8b-4ec3-aefc-9edd551823b1 n=1 Tax=Thermothielavioides terrestris TaxID=2587410 RepID=A0A3S4AUB1_9PEZI|nr:bce21ee6-5e8b-4ec3-aefc-9edd551823b1 [Thermothielavioides terrestris]